MKKLVLLFVLLPAAGFSQLRFKYGVEAGYACGGKSSGFVHYAANGNRSAEQNINRKSFVWGLHTQVQWRKYFYFALGLQYQEKGSTFAQDRYGETHHHGPYISYLKETFRFKKVCAPLSMGFTTRIRRMYWLQPAVFAGIRPNILLDTRLRIESTIDHVGTTPDSYSNNEYDLMEQNKSGIVQHQFFLGASLLFFDRFKLSFTINEGPGVPYIPGPINCEGKHLANNDYMLSLAILCGKTWDGCRLKRSTGYRTVRFL